MDSRVESENPVGEPAAGGYVHPDPPEPKLCLRRVIASLIEANSRDPNKPSWSQTLNANLELSRITGQFAFLLALSEAAAEPPSPSADTLAPTDIP